MKRSWIARVVAGVVLFSVHPVWAWGPAGHEMVGVIASYYLTPTAREKVEIILGDKRLGDPEISCWPDEIRGAKEYEALYPQNRRWHYVDWDVALPYTNDFKIPENYIASHLPVVREQLQKAGVRLARLLNGALDPEYPAAAK